MSRRKVLVGLVLVLVAGTQLVSGGLVATARAVNAPTPAPCVGSMSISRPIGGGSTLSADAYANCGFHSLLFSGTAASGTIEDICAATAVSLQFVGTETINGVPSAAPATWTISGSHGAFVVNAGSGRVGAYVADPRYDCSGYVVPGVLVLVDTNSRAPAPDVFACHASAHVTPDFVLLGPPGYSVSGPAVGDGTCQSTQGPRQVHLDGYWYRNGESQQVCDPSRYSFTLDVPDVPPKIGLYQEWTPMEHGLPTMTVSSAGVPLGGGRFEEAPGPCSHGAPYDQLPPPFDVTADWVFLAF